MMVYLTSLKTVSNTYLIRIALFYDVMVDKTPFRPMKLAVRSDKPTNNLVASACVDNASLVVL